MSSSGSLNTVVSAISGGIIAAIVVGSVVGLALCIGFIVCMYCLCCRQKKTRPAPFLEQPYRGLTASVTSVEKV